MPSRVVRFRPRRYDALAEALQLILGLDHLQQGTKDELAGVLGKVGAVDEWGYVMLNPAQQRLVIKALNRGPKPAITSRVWLAAISYIAYNRGGEIMADRTTLAEAADTTPQEVSRAMTRLVEIGAVVRLKAGRYAVNPHVGWSGNLVKRQEIASSHPELRLVQP